MRAYLVHPDIRIEDNMRTPAARLEEAVGLSAAIDIDVVMTNIAPITQPRPATLFGGGKVEEIKRLLDEESERPGLVIVDGALTPVQHRNLEETWKVKVLDRTALILEIFGARAHTAEGRLQVELAHLTYQRSRLVRSWTHLERQRGGAGFLGGPGERQIESDRRALDVKIVRLRRKIENVRKARTLQRAQRKRAPHPIVALVGYTNAGKSTLFNRLSDADVMAEDLLFATLDPTMRAIDLPSGTRIVLSDTVGFISDLPTQLVAAFRATLEEVLEADIIVHVRDIAHADSHAQKEDVLGVLSDLGVDENTNRPIIEALNKIDLLDEKDRAALMESVADARVGDEEQSTLSARIAISAQSGERVDELLELIDGYLTADFSFGCANIPHSAGDARAWLVKRADILNEEIDDTHSRLQFRISEKTKGQFAKVFPTIKIYDLDKDEEIRLRVC